MTASAADSPGLGLVKQNAVVVPPNTANLGRRRNASQEVGVRIDAAGQDITPPRVDDRGIVAGPACHAGDPPAFDNDISPADAFRRHQPTPDALAPAQSPL